MQIVFATIAWAQQDAQYTMYMWNQLSVNPAYAGSRECLTANMLRRSQWIKTKGAPTTTNWSVNSPLKNERVALGINLTNDHIGVSRFTNISFAYAYRLPVNSKGKLSMGLQGVINAVNHQYADLFVFDTDDANFTNSAKALTSVNFGTGLYYSTNTEYVGISIPHIINNKFYEKSNSTISLQKARQYRHLFIMAGKVYSISDELKFKPSTLIKFAPHAPIQFDFNAALLIREVMWIGTTLRSDFGKQSSKKFESFNVMAAYEINQIFRIGMAYDITLSNLSYFNNGSFELMLGYDFNQLNKKINSPRYF